MCQWTTAVLKRELKHPIGRSPEHSLYEDVNMWLILGLLTNIPDICHERHESIHVIFFWPV